MALLLFVPSCSQVASNLPNHSTDVSSGNSSVQPVNALMALDPFLGGDCSFNGPPIKGSTNQGGYVFEYESYSGTGPTGACRLYRLRNTPGKLYTPVLWKDSGEIWFDTALPACPAGSICPSIDVMKQSLRVEDGGSTLTYGVNKNEYSEAPSAFKRHQNEKFVALSGNAYPFVTTISGVIADANGRPIQISIRVASFVETGAKGELESPINFGYRFETGPRAENLFSIDLAQQDPKAAYRISWGATSTSAFKAAATAEELKWLSGPEQRAHVSFSSRSVTLNDQEKLIITQGTTPIFVTTASAYVPKEPE